MEARVEEKYRVRIPDAGYWRENINCQEACPVQTDARGYVRAIARGDYREAYRLARGPNPLASICGRICGAPCEAACRRGTVDKPIAIRALKRFACEQAGVEAVPDHPETTIKEVTSAAGEVYQNASLEEIRLLLEFIKKKTGQKPTGGVGGPILGPPDFSEHPASPVRANRPKIAIIGSGPAGLAAAHDLALLGFQPIVYEMEPVPAGMLSLGVPAYRLPTDLIEAEVEVIRSLGVEFRCGVCVGKDLSLQELRRTHRAVVIAVGAKRSRGLPIKNSDVSGVVGGVEFLRSVALGEPLRIGRRVIVIGGGNVAYDVARTVLRQESYDVARTARRTPGVQEVRLCALESLEEMPADTTEIQEGEEEGVIRHNSLGPHEILVDDEGVFKGVVFKKCLRVFDDEKRFNPLFDEADLATFEADTLLLSIGQQIRLDFVDPERDGIRLTERGFVDCDPETMQSRTAPDVFVAGDCAHGPKLAIHAIANGKKAARGIYGYLTGRKLSSQAIEIHRPIPDYQRERDYEKIPRTELPTLSVSERRASLSKPIELSLSEKTARCEASRCLDCGVNTIFDGEKCILCGGCVDVCPEYCLKIVPLTEVAGGELLDRLTGRCFEEPSQKASVIIKDETKCIRCGLCAERCPTGAVTMERFSFREDWREERAEGYAP